MSDPSADKPLPEPTPGSAPFWEGLKAHKLVLQRCTNCQRLRHYPRPMCDHCHSMESDWVEATPKGTVYSWTVAHHPFHPGFKQELPYVVVTVEMADGVRMAGRLTGNDAGVLRVGQPVRLEYDDVDESLSLPRFTVDE